MIKKISAAVLIAIGFLIILNLTKQIATALNSGKRLDSEADQLSKLQKENTQLQEQLAQVESYDYTERTIRNELNMSKPGETVVIIPDDVLSKALGLDKKPPPPPLPDWQRWFKLIFH